MSANSGVTDKSAPWRWASRAAAVIRAAFPARSPAVGLICKRAIRKGGSFREFFLKLKAIVQALAGGYQARLARPFDTAYPSPESNLFHTPVYTKSKRVLLPTPSSI